MRDVENEITVVRRNSGGDGCGSSIQIKCSYKNYVNPTRLSSSDHGDCCPVECVVYRLRMDDGRLYTEAVIVVEARLMNANRTPTFAASR